MVLLQGMQQAFGSIRVDRPEFLHQFLHLLPLGFAVRGAGGGDDRERQRFEHMLYMGLRQVDKRPDYGDPCAAHQRLRMEGMEPPLVEQAHEERFQHILAMVPQCQFVASQFLAGFGQNSPAHLGAKGAGVLFLTVFKDDLADLCFFNDIGNLQLFAQGPDS